MKVVFIYAEKYFCYIIKLSDQLSYQVSSELCQSL